MSEKKRLVEKYIVTPENYHKREGFTESEEVISIEEGKQKKEYKAKAIYTFPISKPDVENLNERIYSSKLWENVMKKMKNQSTPGLMDHPKDEGSTKDMFCVWRNLRFSEDKKTMLADAYLFGTWGQQVKEYLEAGGLVGLSTSGFGEMEEDSKKVKEDTYDLERVADFVFNPSYEVFGKAEDRVDADEPVEEKIEESEQPEVLPEETLPEEVPAEEPTEEIEEETLDTEIDKEKKPMNGVEKASEKSFRLNINSLFKEARTVEKLGERITAYQELLSYFDEGVAEDLRDEIQTALDADLQLKEEMAVKGEQADALVEEKATELQNQIEALEKEKEALLKEKEELELNFNNATELLDSMKVYANKLKELYETSKAEKNGMITASEYKEALAYIEELEEAKKEAERKVVQLRKEEGEEPEEDETEDDDEEDVAEKKKKKKKEYDDEDDVAEKKKKKEYANVDADILSYYEDLEYHEPLVIKIKDDILRCKTLIEAQRTYLRLKSLLKENPEYDRKVVADNRSLYEKQKEVRKVAKLKIPKGWV